MHPSLSPNRRHLLTPHIQKMQDSPLRKGKIVEVGPDSWFEVPSGKSVIAAVPLGATWERVKSTNTGKYSRRIYPGCFHMVIKRAVSEVVHNNPILLESTISSMVADLINRETAALKKLVYGNTTLEFVEDTVVDQLNSLYVALGRSKEVIFLPRSRRENWYDPSKLTLFVAERGLNLSIQEEWVNRSYTIAIFETIGMVYNA